jgi:hypothetical protein
MPNVSRKNLEEIFPDSFFSDDEEFVREFGFLDEECQTALWKPYSIDGKGIGSYGPTLGVALPVSSDAKRARKEKLALMIKAEGRILFSFLVEFFHRFKKIF